MRSRDASPVLEELKQVKFQSATLTFDHDFTIDLGNREVQVKFLGRGNTAGDAVAYLPKEKIVSRRRSRRLPHSVHLRRLSQRVDPDAAKPRPIGRGHDRSRPWAGHARQDLRLSASRSVEERGRPDEREAHANRPRNVSHARSK